MLRKFFAYDGKIVGFLNKTGEIILLNIVFLLCCLPVVTIGPALTSFYYAMIKSIRRERGTPLREFWHSMKRTLGRGVLLTIGILLWAALLWYGFEMTRARSQGTISFSMALYFIFIVVSLCILIYLFPVFSRFEMGAARMLQLSFVMSIRFFPITVIVAAGSALVGWLTIYVLPIACILVIPGVWCYLVTFLMERALLHYMPEAKPGEEQWYDGDDPKDADRDT
ncbi:MAG: YesL family protein [Bacteroidales bacterium]|nr:YesL family protein [Bacteroidales bacterium]MCM1414730.1 YesL family protein [bacterium]MCM1422539.1 YesL family protein [bacterium]